MPPRPTAWPSHLGPSGYHLPLRRAISEHRDPTLHRDGRFRCIQVPRRTTAGDLRSIPPPFAPPPSHLVTIRPRVGDATGHLFPTRPTPRRAVFIPSTTGAWIVTYRDHASGRPRAGFQDRADRPLACIAKFPRRVAADRRFPSGLRSSYRSRAASAIIFDSSELSSAVPVRWGSLGRLGFARRLARYSRVLAPPGIWQPDRGDQSDDAMPAGGLG